MKRSQGYLTYVLFKLKNDSPLQILYHALNAVGIRIQPFYVVQEGLSGVRNPFLKHSLQKYKVSFFSANDMLEIANLPDRNISHRALIQRLNDGKLCIGAKGENRIVAFTWCDIEWCNFPGYRFPLDNDETYLFDAHTSTAYRGIGLAPFVRYRMYEELEQIGKKRLYSITERFNKPAIRFKQKLRSKIIDKGEYIELFGRWSFCQNRCHFKNVVGENEWTRLPT